jgi:hypothetical protein
MRCAKKDFCPEESLILAEKYTEILRMASGYVNFLRNLLT